MKQSILFFVMLLVSFLPSGLASAQETRLGTSSANANSQLEEQSVGERAMRERFMRVAQFIAMAMDSHLDYLSKPSTTGKLAKFQKNYFDALVQQGFTEEQAIRIISSSANPLIGFQTPFPPQ